MIIVITADTPSASARTKTTAPSRSGYRLALSAIDQRAKFGATVAANLVLFGATLVDGLARSRNVGPPMTAMAASIEETDPRSLALKAGGPLASSCRAPRCSIADRLAFKVVHLGNRREASTIVQAVYIDDGAHALAPLRDSGDKHTAATADEEITGAAAESIPFDQRPIIRPHLERPLRVREHARIVAATKRTGACPK